MEVKLVLNTFFPVQISSAYYSDIILHIMYTNEENVRIGRY
jgi:hypothetical protein